MKFRECIESVRRSGEAMRRLLPTIKEAVKACKRFNEMGPKIKDLIDVAKNRNAENAKKGNKEYYLDLHTILNFSPRKLGKLVKKKTIQGYKIMIPNFNVAGFEITKATNKVGGNKSQLKP